MAVGSRALKEARLDSMRRRRKKRDRVIPDLSVTENLEPNYVNLSKELPKNRYAVKSGVVEKQHLFRICLF